MEPLSRAVSEMNDLILGYYADTNAQEGIPPLRMDWAFFAALEKQDKLVIITAREHNVLLGFAMYMVVAHPQHGGMLSAMCNTLAVTTSQRGKGIGTQLVEAALSYFKATGSVKLIFHGHRSIYKVEPLFPKLGFHAVETNYMKVL